MLPVTSSISYSFTNLGSYTKIEISNSNNDIISFNNEILTNNTKIAKKIIDYVDLFRYNNKELKLQITTINNIPTAAGLASSASGFSSLIKALNDFFNLNLSDKNLSILARLGSGSACRSIFPKFTIWHKGDNQNGIDSFAEKIESNMQDFGICIILLSYNNKSISSTEAMQITLDTSPLYHYWSKNVENDINNMLLAIKNNDFTTLGSIAEYNAMLMHSTMHFACPKINYLTEESILVMKKIQEIRKNNLEIYFTIDAGPNIKIIYKKSDQQELKNLFKEYRILFDE
jgi:diphosphomevalonate decarboxylase